MNIQRYIKPILPLALALVFTACEIEPIPDPNNPDSDRIQGAAALSELQNLATGIESGMRDNLNNYYDDVSVIGREYYRFSTSDPRFTSDLLGKESAVLDNNTFYITNPYGARYRVIKNVNILLNALNNTRAAISENQRKAGIGYAKTIKAYQLLLVLNLLHNNGIRVDVENPDQLGPFLNRQQSLDAIIALLDEAYAGLENNGENLPFTTTLTGRKGSEFGTFNRALAARVNVYKEAWTSAEAALNKSFFDLNGSLTNGVFHVFSTAGNDQLNPLFFPLESKGETRVTHPSFVTDALPGDTRVNKAPVREAEFQDGLQSNRHFFVYKTNTDALPIIRNEELVLLYAEIKAQTGSPADAVAAINKVRAAAGLSNYTGATDKMSLINEILFQRRYSLFGEGHRWIDLRRYGLLGQLPKDRAGDDVWEQFPIPANE